ncbi:hypothetical protein NBRC116597_29810 [Phaeobacter sp. NW0010-22]
MTDAAGNAGADQTSNTAALPTVIAPPKQLCIIELYEACENEGSKGQKNN